jgi:eukaryotic-like serine/threonine-protein kinase
MRGTIIVDKYRLNAPLGSGGMAEVWSATNTFTERQVAIKFLGRDVVDHPEACERFLREAKITARIGHPNIIDVLDVGRTHEGQLFLVMELLTGLPLEIALHRQNPALTLHDFTVVMLGVARALEAAHASGIVHRDLKPTNIFLHKPKDGTLVPKLLDFGVSKFLDAQSPALTTPGTVLGSALYMSPEQARGEELDGRTDIFSFGAILFEALTGQRAYEAKNFHALLVAIATTRPKDIDVVAPSVPECLRRVVRACVMADREARASTFAEVAALLGRALPELTASGRLPRPLFMAATIDPDATNALPVLRGISHATTYAASTTAPSVRRASTRYLLPAVAVGSLALGLLGARATAPTAHTSNAIPTASAASVTPVERSPEPGPTQLAPPEPTPGPRGVSVESLPDAPKLRGRLAVTSSGSACTVWIDGRERGATPYSVELPSGPHDVACTHGRFDRRAKIVVRDAAVATFHAVVPAEDAQ